MIHLWVDPIYGDDGAVNRYFNPDGLGWLCGLPNETAPHHITDSSGSVLLHAPYPFKTITAAVGYIMALSPTPPPSGPLPHTSTTTGITWSYCVIHLLPGLYSSAANVRHLNNRNQHLDNGLYPNGENFPIHLPPRVSIQGTSALNTLFDLGESETAFRFGEVYQGVAINGEGTFIDSVTFYAGGQHEPGTASNRVTADQVAAIYIHDDVSSKPTISNCFFVLNNVGILVNASSEVQTPPPSEPVVRHDGTTIVNNTFAWNWIGLWNGQVTNALESDGSYGSMQPSTGVSRLNVFNNIFDATHPGDPTGTLVLPCGAGQNGPPLPASWPTSMAGRTFQAQNSGFEGMSAFDMQVLLPGGPLDTNAYEFGGGPPATPGFNNGTNLQVWDPNAPGGGRQASITTGVRGTDPSPFPVGARNIAPITGWNAQVAGQGMGAPRGILYIRDLFCVGQVPAANGGTGAFPLAGFDGSPLDFRLSPSVRPAAPGDYGPPTMPNPLIDSGYGGPFPVSMANGNVLNHPPGFLPMDAASQPTWAFHSFNWDCEGYGNPRILIDAPPDLDPEPIIDVGADEVSGLIVAGYRMGTTTFLGMNGVSPRNPYDDPFFQPPASLQQYYRTAIRNNTLYYLGPAGTALPAAVPQPDFRVYTIYASGNPRWDRSWPSTYDNPTPTTLSFVWHSGETQSCEPRLDRPWYGLGVAGGGPPVPTPPPVTPPVLPQDLGPTYLATLADVTPHLLPDVHPWWSPFATQFINLTNIVLNEVPPSLTVWHTCVTSFMAPFRNPYLFFNPTAGRIHPPGSYTGGAMTQSGATRNYTYLDAGTYNLMPAVTLPFEHWNGTAMMLTDFDAWCRGGTMAGPMAGRSVLLPATQSVNCSIQDPSALRFTLEPAAQDPLWGGAPNLQTFLVYVEPGL